MISINPNEETPLGKYVSLAIHNGFHSQIWIIDSGATHHICYEINLFISKRKVNHYTVTLPNNMVIPVHIICDVQIDHIFILKDVLYVPEFDLNLISVSSLTKIQKHMIKFTCDHAYIQDVKHQKMIGRANRIEDLYVLKSTKANVSVVSLDTWHRRLGHPSNKHIISIRNQLENVICTSNFHEHYLVCPLAKQKRLPFRPLNNV